LDLVFDNLDRFVEGIRTTVGLTLLGYAGAFAIGLVIAACRVSPVPPLRWAGATYVELVRNTPLPVLFGLFFFGVTKLGVTYTPYTSAVIVLAAYTGAFIAETVRSGINAVATGQAEAARSLGLTFTQTLRIVVLPQALRTVVAPLGSLFVALTKNSSIAYTISVVELVGVASILGVDEAEPVPFFLAAAMAYLILTIPSGLLIDTIERRVAIRR
jgi:glutamate transport system permease protein